jgi:hypothetical protein
LQTKRTPETISKCPTRLKYPPAQQTPYKTER